ELVDNALKFSEMGTPVKVSSWVDNESYHVTVRDGGRGMSDQEIERIGAYMQFQRHLYEQSGLGLGLIITKKYMQLFNGQFVINSVLNHFTEVTLTFQCA